MYQLETRFARINYYFLCARGMRGSRHRRRRNNVEALAVVTYVRNIDAPTCVYTGMDCLFFSVRSKGGSWHRRRRRTMAEVVTYARNLIHIYSTSIYTPEQDRRRQRSRGNSDGEVVTYERGTWYIFIGEHVYDDTKISPI